MPVTGTGMMEGNWHTSVGIDCSNKPRQGLTTLAT
ncbi:hypothetical protein EV128_1197 [Rhizobium azibense]|nr:hypothetical protein EV128_1197 [Rhizobium azibense]